MHVLITRPEPDATRWQTHLAALGIASTVDPLLTIEPVAIDQLPLAGIQALIATSRNGLRWLGPSPARASVVGLPMFAVGPGTARLAADIGFQRIIEGPASARDLVPLIVRHADPRAGHLLHLSGDKVAFDLVDALRPHGLTVDRHVVYRSRPASRLAATTETRLADGTINAVLLTSPLAAMTFVALARSSQLSERCGQLVYICLSETIAAEVASLNPARVHVALEPNSDATLARLEQLVLAPRQAGGADQTSR